MWIRKLPSEAGLEKQSRLLHDTCLDVLLGATLWCILVRLSAFFGLPCHGPVSGYVCCGVVAFILPAAWYAGLKGEK
jgi:hypothetical protein